MPKRNQNNFSLNYHSNSPREYELYCCSFWNGLVYATFVLEFDIIFLVHFKISFHSLFGKRLILKCLVKILWCQVNIIWGLECLCTIGLRFESPPLFVIYYYSCGSFAPKNMYYTNYGVLTYMNSIPLMHYPKQSFHEMFIGSILMFGETIFFLKGGVIGNQSSSWVYKIQKLIWHIVYYCVMSSLNRAQYFVYPNA